MTMQLSLEELANQAEVDPGYGSVRRTIGSSSVGTRTPAITRSCSDPTGRRELGIDRTNLFREIVMYEAPSFAWELVPIGTIAIPLTTAMMGCFFSNGSSRAHPRSGRHRTIRLVELHLGK
jgi:hypothetical protein